MFIEAGAKTAAHTGNTEARLCVTTILPSKATKAVSLPLLVGLSSAPLELREPPQSLFHMTTFQPREDRNSRPLKSLVSKLNSPGSTLKTTRLPHLSTCLSPRNRSYFTSPGSSIFSALRAPKERKIYLPNQGLIPREIPFHSGSPRAPWLRHLKPQLGFTTQ